MKWLLKLLGIDIVAMQRLVADLQIQNERLLAAKQEVRELPVLRIEYNPAIDLEKLNSIAGYGEVSGDVCEPLARIFQNSTFKSYLVQKRDAFINSLVREPEYKAGLVLRGKVLAIDELYLDLSKFAEVLRVKTGMKEARNGV